MLVRRLTGGFEEGVVVSPAKFSPPVVARLTELAPLKFLEQPGLWIGLVIAQCLSSPPSVFPFSRAPQSFLTQHQTPMNHLSPTYRARSQAWPFGSLRLMAHAEDAAIDLKQRVLTWFKASVPMLRLYPDRPQRPDLRR